MIIKCSQCQQPLHDSIKDRPVNLPDDVRWMTCKDCGLGVEVLGDAPKETDSSVQQMQYQETVTITQYVTIKKTKTGVMKYKYSDPERKILIGEEKLG